MRLVEGRIPLLSYHQQRVDRARRSLYAKAPAFKLKKLLADWELPTTGQHKVRVVYGSELDGYTITPYEQRPVETLRAVHADDMDYGKKYADRSGINALFERRDDCDDILIVKRGHITDSSYANLAFDDGTHWYTPAWPLLRGTRREQLVERGILRTAVIRLRDLHHFRQVKLLNAMIEWPSGPTFPVNNIRLD